MKAVWFFFLLQFLIMPIAKADFQCDNLIGSWESSRYDTTMAANMTTRSAYNADHTWHFNQYVDGALEDVVRHESGTWSCEGNNFLMHVYTINDEQWSEPLTHRYKILNLDYNFFKFEVDTDNCDQVISDCEGVIFESTRIYD